MHCLNADMLFPDHASADRFRSFYMTQPWAETEDEAGEFSVIRIETVALSRMRHFPGRQQRLTPRAASVSCPEPDAHSSASCYLRGFKSCP
jgi:hypothetical protein